MSVGPDSDFNIEIFSLATVHSLKVLGEGRGGQTCCEARYLKRISVSAFSLLSTCFLTIMYLRPKILNEHVQMVKRDGLRGCKKRKLPVPPDDVILWVTA